jgi:hypothetical protein
MHRPSIDARAFRASIPRSPGVADDSTAPLRRSEWDLGGYSLRDLVLPEPPTAARARSRRSPGTVVSGTWAGSPATTASSSASFPRRRWHGERPTSEPAARERPESDWCPVSAPRGPESSRPRSQGPWSADPVFSTGHLGLRHALLDAPPRHVVAVVHTSITIGPRLGPARRRGQHRPRGGRRVRHRACGAAADGGRGHLNAPRAAPRLIGLASMQWERFPARRAVVPCSRAQGNPAEGGPGTGRSSVRDAPRRP